MAQTNSQPIQGRPRFLCSDNRPTEQTSSSLGHYEVCLNPYPIFRRHLTTIEEEHTSQTIKNCSEDMLFPVEDMSEFLILYNGSECGASAPSHIHFQAAGKEKRIANPFEMTFMSDMFSSEDNMRNHLKDGFITSIDISSPNRRGIIEMFEYLYDKVASICHGKEPLTDVIAWYGLETISRTGGDEIKQWNYIISLRSKHRPECYYIQGKKDLLINPAIVEIYGVFPIVREENLDRIAAKKIT